MNKVVLGSAALFGALLVGCSSSRASISPVEQLAVHYGARGEMHQRLDALEGTFDVTSSFWARSNAIERVSTGTMTSSWDDQALCMHSEYEGGLAGAPMSMTSAMTWDDVRSCYVGVWMAADGTSAMALADGHVDEHGAIVTMRCDDETSIREVLEVVSEDEHVREVYRTTPDGVEYLSWRLHMTRSTD